MEEKNKALQFAMKLIGLRKRSALEMEKRLEKKGFDARTAKEVLEELKNYGYIDDEQFAESYINDRINFSPRGSFLIRKELREKGVPQNIIEDKVNMLVGEEKEKKLAEYSAEKKLKTMGKNTDKEKRYQKIAAYLQSKGYQAQIISQVLENKIK